ncbi:MAG TPA: disulfide oxidoreductase [Ruminococcaceae bacterium]|jgi:hybrid cluster-associated redox disulfide protein|nr:DUF1858 domain-containing protein [Oscillospiraceae bacterium]HCA72056.1 disulfide oxidoreductase [Oscillospiraceae bacterium]HCC03042.1 disulfide oxidoreductase [Oscillospiraceae bacterium]HCM24136.1 disulfide oxidoreductase [Oscillospiraceae bacterium]
MTVTKDSVIGDILKADNSTAPLFIQMGMYCFECPAALGETLAQACAVHGIDVQELVDVLNQHLAQQPPKQE